MTQSVTRLTVRVLVPQAGLGYCVRNRVNRDSMGRIAVRNVCAKTAPVVTMSMEIAPACQERKGSFVSTGATRGFYGLNCDLSCRCLNGATCDAEGGKCFCPSGVDR